MKKTLLILSVISAFGFSALSSGLGVSAQCVRKTKGDLLRIKTMTIRLTGNTVLFQGKGTGGLLKGVYSKTAKSGFLMYDSADLAAIGPDQVDYGYVLVSPVFAKTGRGEVSFSVRQVGDSEGAWWITDTYDCLAK